MVQGRKMRNYGRNKILDLNTSFKRYLYKLSENHKIIEIGSIMAVERFNLTIIQLTLF